MASEEELEESSTPRLLLSLKPHHAHAHTPQSPERSGMLTPPLHTSVSVPFWWEEEPGKPRERSNNPFSKNLNIDLTKKCLDPPPRLFVDATFANKLPSPTTVLDGPYMGKLPRYQSSSFRIIRRECYGSFRNSCSPERDELGPMVVRKRSGPVGLKERGFWGVSWGFGRKSLKGKRDAGGGSYIFPSLLDREADDGGTEEEEKSSGKKVEATRIRRTGSFTTVSHARPPFWTTIYEGLKQVVTWRSRELKKDEFVF